LDEQLGLLPPKETIRSAHGTTPAADDAPAVESGGNDDDELELRIVDDDRLEDQELELVDMTEDAHVPLAELDEPDSGATPGAEIGGLPAVDVDDVLPDPFASEGDAAESPSSLRRAPGLPRSLRDLLGSGRPRLARWDSPLLLVGGGALLLLGMLGAILLFFLLRGSGDELFAAAEEAYRQGAYQQAIDRFEQLSSSFPGHPQASLARVRSGLARVRQVADNARDWPAALEIARQVLPAIEGESAFHEARTELAGLLPDVATGLVRRAAAADKTTDKQALVPLVREALALVNNSNYLPTSLRRAQQGRIEEVESTLQVVLRDINREQDLASTLARIRSEVAAGRIATAHALREGLLQTYPGLRSRDELRSAVDDIVQAEVAAVRPKSTDLVASQEDHRLDAPVRVAWGDRRGGTVSSVKGEVLAFLVEGAVYGLQADTGEVLWRRFVGFESPVFPQRCNQRPGSDVIIVDGRQPELVRLAARDGRLVWRLPCPAPLAPPVVLPDRILLACGPEENSQLLVVDPASGEVRQAVRFPLAWSGPCAVDGERREIYQLATHSSLYVLDLDTLQCKQVVHLGHRRGSIRAGPAAAADCVVVAENRSVDAARLHLLQRTAENRLVAAGEPLRLNGKVLVPIQASDGRVCLATDRGDLYLLEGGTAVGQPLRELAHVSAGGPPSQPRFPLLAGGHVWLAGQGLTEYSLLATRGQLRADWVWASSDRFLGPLERIGDVLFHARQRKGMRGATITASRVADSGAAESARHVWQTDVGAPLVVLDAEQGTWPSAITANGAWFTLGGESLRAGRDNSSQARVDARLLRQALVQDLPQAGGDRVLVPEPPAEQFALFRPQEDEPLRVVAMAADEGRLAAALTWLDPWLVAPVDSGAVYALDPKSGQAGPIPFQPEMSVGGSQTWVAPATLKARQQIVVATRDGQLYRLGIDAQPRPYLRQLATTGLDRPLSTGLAATGDCLYAVLRNLDGNDAVVAIDPERLAPVAEWTVAGPVVWGPRQVGAFVMLRDDEGNLHCFSNQKELAWRVQHPFAPLAGAPIPVEDRFVFACTDGTMGVLDADGSLVGQHSVGEPLGGSPVIFRERLLVPGWDGTVYLTDVPQP
jgi:outer membrane protein assembly factor BamB